MKATLVCKLGVRNAKFNQTFNAGEEDANQYTIGIPFGGRFHEGRPQDKKGGDEERDDGWHAAPEIQCERLTEKRSPAEKKDT